MAEREGFEPPVGLRLHVLSKHAHSTTLPPLRDWPKGRFKLKLVAAVNGNSSALAIILLGRIL